MFLIGFRIISFDIFNRSEDSGWDSHGNEQSIPLRAVGKKKNHTKVFLHSVDPYQMALGDKNIIILYGIGISPHDKKNWLTDWLVVSFDYFHPNKLWASVNWWMWLTATGCPSPWRGISFFSSSFDDLDTKCNHKTSSDLVWWLQTSFPPSPHICIPLDRQISPASARVSVHPHPYFRYSKCHRSNVFIGTMLPHPTPADSAQSTGKLVFSFFFKYW